MDIVAYTSALPRLLGISEECLSELGRQRDPVAIANQGAALAQPTRITKIVQTYQSDILGWPRYIWSRIICVRSRLPLVAFLAAPTSLYEVAFSDAPQDN